MPSTAGVFVSDGGLASLSDLSISILGDDARFAARERTEATTKVSKYVITRVNRSTYRSSFLRELISPYSNFFLVVVYSVDVSSPTSFCCYQNYFGVVDCR